MLLRTAELLWYASRPLVNRALPDAWAQKLTWWRHRYLPRTETRGDGKVKHSLRPCDEMGCIFVHIPKAAGTSVAHGLFGRGVGHKSIYEYRKIFGADFQEYFKFAVVRNPFSRVVSAYESLRRGGEPGVAKRSPLRRRSALQV